jgi:hypothetical protein
MCLVLREIAHADHRSGIDDHLDAPTAIISVGDDELPEQAAGMDDHFVGRRPHGTATYLGGRDHHLVMLEIDRHHMALQRVESEQAGGPEIARFERRRLDPRAADRADADRGDDEGIDRARARHRGEMHIGAGREAQRAGQLARDDGALRAGIDDEMIGPARTDRHRHGHALVIVAKAEQVIRRRQAHRRLGQRHRGGRLRGRLDERRRLESGGGRERQGEGQARVHR